MIKFVADTEGGGRLIGLGLSRGNCERLLAHKPISIDMRKDLRLPWKGEILLLADENEKALRHSLRNFITEETIVHEDDSYVEEPKPAEPMQMSVSAANDGGRDFILIDLNGPRSRFGLTAEEARRLAEALVEQAAKVEKAPGPPGPA
jgi:hypothetical protein